MAEDSETREADGNSADPIRQPPPDRTVELGEALRKSTDHFPQASTGDDDPPPSMFIEPEPTPTQPADTSPPPEPPSDED